LETERARRFLDDVNSNLPQSLKERLNRKVFIELKELNDNDNPFERNCNLTEESHGEVWAQAEHPVGLNYLFNLSARRESNTVFIDEEVLPLIVGGRYRSRSINCHHGNMYKEALALALHEIVHLYDFLNWMDPETSRLKEICRKKERRQWISKEEKKILNKALRISQRACKRVLWAGRNTISDDVEFMNITNFNQKGSLIKDWSNANYFYQRSPDQYEFDSPSESFAVNMEYFLLDKTFQCRRPRLNQYFASHFGYQPHSNSTCKVNYEVFLDSEMSYPLEFSYKIDPSKIYQIEYLWAGEGPQFMSKWGHSSYRLVMCAPEREEVSEECLYDQEYHIVLSFRAHINELSIDTFAGLSGEYPSKLFIIPFLEVVEEYTKAEFRPLYGVKLNLTPQQKMNFLHASLEKYWSYIGKYYFLGNNCAVEAQNLLRSAVDIPLFHHRQTLTPTDLIDELENAGLAQENSLEAVEEEMTFFPSYEVTLNEVFDKSPYKVDFESKEDLFENSNANKRKAYFSKDDQSSVAQALILEKHISYLRNKEMREQSLSILNGSDFESDKKDILEFIRFITNLNQFILVNHGYGIPLASEVKDSDYVQNRKLINDFRKANTEWYKNHLSDEKSEIDRIRENVELLNDRLFDLI
jgi:hypothetical protein